MIREDTINAGLLKQAGRLPIKAAAARKRFLHWRLTCADDFEERLRARSTSELALRMGTHPGIAAVVLEAEGWTEIPRKDNEKRYWAPPIRETFLNRAARV